MALSALVTFGRGGIHPDPSKELTADRDIEAIQPPPREVWLPLGESLGEPATPIAGLLT